MNRGQFTALALGAAIEIPLAAADVRNLLGVSELPKRPLRVPPGGTIRTAVAVGPGVNVIDMAGPWEVFQDAVVAGGSARFQLFTVARDASLIRATGGLTIKPDYSYDTAPQPHVVVVPAHQSTGRTLKWLRDVSRRTDLLMSVCTGAFVLAEAGLLDGKSATTHHQFYDQFTSAFPKVRLVRGRRFVEHERVATAGGLTSGIDLALRVVERYLGRLAAVRTARYMEYRRAS
jgi:transcriptional regulator GlxA family with amidase domain